MRKDWTWTLCVSLLCLLPIVPSLVFTFTHPWRPASTDDDAAILEIDTLQAARGVARLGPYSRFEWRHPGPALFYALVPVYEIGRERIQALYVGAMLLNAFAAAAVVLLSARLGARGFALAASGALAALLAVLGPRTLASIWNPHVTVLALCLFVFLCAGTALQGLRFVPPAALAGTFLVQSHIGYLPAVGVLCCAALCLRAVPWARHTGAPAIPAAASATAFVLTAAAWIPPLLEQVRERPGNLTSLVRFFAKSRPTHSLRDVLPPFAERLSALPLALATKPGALLLSAAAALELLLLAAVLRRAWRRRQPFAFVLGTLGAAGCAAALGALTRVEGEIYDYLSLWIAALGVVLWTAILGSPTDRPPSWAGALVALAAVAAAERNRERLPAEPPIPYVSFEKLERARDSVESFLARTPGPPPLMRIRSHDSWAAAAGLFRDLYKDRVPFCVEDSWLFMFGSRFAANGRPSRDFLIGNEDLRGEMGSRPDVSYVGGAEDLVIFAVTDPDYLERHLVRGRARLVDADGAVGEVDRVCDGVFPPDGAAWDCPECVKLSGASSHVTVEAPAGISGLVISADQNDSYTVSVSADGGSFHEVGFMRAVPGHGMQRRALFSERLPGARFVRVSPREGDGHYSIGEIGFVVP